MKINKLLIIGTLAVSSLTNISCSTDDLTESVGNFNIEKYHGMHAQYDVQLSLNMAQDNLVKFEYDAQNRISKRIGNVVYASPSSGIEGYLHNYLYTDLSYSDNKIYLEKKILPNGNFTTVPSNETTFELDSDGRLLQKISFEEFIAPQIDTTDYTYFEGKLSSFTKRIYHDLPDGDIINYEASTLYYTNGNLESISTVFSTKYDDIPFVVLDKKETQLFSGYDNAQNPFKKLQIFEETFNRSLSENNFTEYVKISNTYTYPDNDYYQTPILGPTQQETVQSWYFIYDENGNWMYDQY